MGLKHLMDQSEPGVGTLEVKTLWAANSGGKDHCGLQLAWRLIWERKKGLSALDNVFMK
jgi:hypothetical protein